MNILVTKLTCVALSIALTGPAPGLRSGQARSEGPPAGLVRLELTERPWARAFRSILFGQDGPGLESAAAAAFVEAHRLDGCFPTLWPGANGAR